MKCLCLLAMALGFALDAQAQVAPTSGDKPATTFRAGVDLVALNVVVTDSQNKFVVGLAQADFAVFGDGVQQDVSFFGSSDVPLDIAILLESESRRADAHPQRLLVHAEQLGAGSTAIIQA